MHAFWLSLFVALLAFSGSAFAEDKTDTTSDSTETTDQTSEGIEDNTEE